MKTRGACKDTDEAAETSENHGPDTTLVVVVHRGLSDLLLPRQERSLLCVTTLHRRGGMAGYTYKDPSSNPAHGYEANRLVKLLWLRERYPVTVHLIGEHGVVLMS